MSTPAELTIARGGGTFRADTLEPVNPETGYAVALQGETFALDHDGPTLATVEYAIARFRDGMPFEPRSYNAPYIGTWIDGNALYIDDVLILPDLASALIVARAFGQKAIYSFDQREEIAVISQGTAGQ